MLQKRNKVDPFMPLTRIVFSLNRVLFFEIGYQFSFAGFKTITIITSKIVLMVVTITLRDFTIFDIQ